MDCKALIAFLAFIPSLLFGQPLTVSGLEWPSRVSDCSGVTALNSFFGIEKNSSGAAVPLHGIGGAFSIITSPSHGTLSGLDSVVGSVVYTPNSNYVGGDIFQYNVLSSPCSSNATVYVAVMDTTATNCISTTNVVYVDSGLSATWCMTWTTNGGGSTMICGSNGASGSIPQTPTGNSSDDYCSYLETRCFGLTDTNTFSFNITNSYNNTSYAQWLICNPDSVSHIYQVKGLYSYSLIGPAGGNVGYTLGLFANASQFLNDSHGFGSASVSQNNTPITATVSVPAHTSDMVIRVSLFSSTEAGGVWFGSFTNSFQ